MKKYLSIIALATLIVPSVAFASWWNPVTWFNNWSFLSGNDTKTQILENRINELEMKLASTTTSTATSTKHNLDASATTGTPTYDELLKAKQEKAAAIRTTLNTTSVTAPKPTQTHQDQTLKYKHLLFGDDFINSVTNLKMIPTESNNLISMIDKRIVLVNQLISNYEAVLNRSSSWPELDTYLTNIINGLKLENQYSESVKSELTTINGYSQKSGDVINSEFTRINQLGYITSDDFEKERSNLDILNKNISDVYAAQNKLISDAFATLGKWNDDDRKIDEELGQALSYVSASLNSRPTQNYYIAPAPQVIVPYISPIRTTSCSLTVQNNGSYGAMSGGTLSCISD